MQKPKVPIMKEKALAEVINRYRRNLKILVFTRNLFGITGGLAGVTVIAVPATSFFFWVGFQIFCLAVALLLSLLPLVSAVRGNIRSAEALQATQEDCDAGDALDKWRLNHRLVDWASKEAQELIRRRIETKKRFLETHPFIKDEYSITCLQVQLR